MDGTSVYWTNLGTLPNIMDGSIMKCAVAGRDGAPTILAAGLHGPDSIAVNVENVYWGGQGVVKYCPIGGCAGSPAPLATVGQADPGIYGMILDETHIYWFAGGQLLECPLGGCVGNPNELLNPGNPGGLALDASNVYVAEGGP